MAKDKFQTTNKQVIRAQQDAEILELRKRGLSYREIGESMGMPGITVRSRVVKALENLREETYSSARDILTMELERLESMWAGVAPAAFNGSLRAVEVALKIMERKTKLLGLDAPDRVQIFAEVEHNHEGNIHVLSSEDLDKYRGAVKDMLQVVGNAKFREIQSEDEDEDEEE